MTTIGKKKRRVAGRIVGTAQLELAAGVEPTMRATAAAPETATESADESTVRFVDRDPGKLFVGPKQLGAFLRENGFEWVLDVRKLLREQDWTKMEAAYQPGGRWPYHPATMVGIILFGLMQGVSSLRRLEELASLNVACWWLSGGVMPDHACIGRFINRHGEILTEGFFEALTRSVLGRLGSSACAAAGDGTVIAAAASRYGLLKREAAALAAAQAKARAAAEPDDDALATAAALAAEVARTAEERTAARREKEGRAKDGKDKEARVPPTEPEAVVQPLKTGQNVPSYKPSVLVNPDRIILAHDVQATKETASIPPMLDKAARVAGSPISTLLLDAGYLCGQILVEAIEREIDLLCPEGKGKGEDKNKDDFLKHTKAGKHFEKHRFVFDEADDTYACPAGKLLHRQGAGFQKRTGLHFVQYTAADCQGCPLKAQCFQGKAKTRRIRRYEHDEIKEAEREVMRQPGARRAYRNRKAWVEPVFAEIKGIQGLQRFRRRHAKGARLEWSLHCAAHNLRRYVARRRATRQTLPRPPQMRVCRPNGVHAPARAHAHRVAQTATALRRWLAHGDIVRSRDAASGIRAARKRVWDVLRRPHWQDPQRRQSEAGPSRPCPAPLPAPWL